MVIKMRIVWKNSLQPLSYTKDILVLNIGSTLDISDVPEEIIKMAEDIIRLDEKPRVVTFDENSGIVTFTVGEKTFTYKLPEE
jgi:hypothetical protein